VLFTFYTSLFETAVKKTNDNEKQTPLVCFSLSFVFLTAVSNKLVEINVHHLTKVMQYRQATYNVNVMHRLGCLTGVR